MGQNVYPNILSFFKDHKKRRQRGRGAEGQRDREAEEQRRQRSRGGRGAEAAELTRVCFLDLMFSRRIDGVGATAFPRQPIAIK